LRQHAHPVAIATVREIFPRRFSFAPVRISRIYCGLRPLGYSPQ
jgi:hypothetical protein